MATSKKSRYVLPYVIKSRSLLTIKRQVNKLSLKINKNTIIWFSKSVYQQLFLIFVGYQGHADIL